MCTYFKFRQVQSRWNHTRKTKNVSNTENTKLGKNEPVIDHVDASSMDCQSVRLFLLLNAISAVFPTPASEYPSLLFVISLALLLNQALNERSTIETNTASLVFGVLWAGHMCSNMENSQFLAYNLVTMLSIGTVSFSHKVAPYFLFITPSVVLMCLQVDSWRVMNFVALPSIGIVCRYMNHDRKVQDTERLVRELLEEKQKLSSLSMLDHLTQVYNRRGFHHHLDRILAHGNGSHYILLLDIDNFKLYNDSYGHTMGDLALTKVAGAIKNAVRAEDVVARYGGEEFLVMLTGISSEDRAFQAAERIRQRVLDLEIRHEYSQVAANITVSVGIAPFSGGSVERAISQADTALYKAKDKGRNLSILYK